MENITIEQVSLDSFAPNCLFSFYVLSHEKIVFGQWSFISLGLSNLVTTLALLFLAEQEMPLSCAEMDVVFTSTDIEGDKT